MNIKKLFSREVLLFSFITFELMVYSFRFIRWKPESVFHPEHQLVEKLSDKRGFDKINSLNSGPDNYTLNSGILLNSENINGYNPIFSKRLLWAVNAAEGRPADTVESVSLNLTKRDNHIYRIAGASTNLFADGTISEATPSSNIFRSVKIIEDQELFQKIILNEVKPEDQIIYIKSSDSNLTNITNTVLPPCNGAPRVDLVPGVQLQLSVKTDCEIYFVYPYLYYPGWSIKFGNTTQSAFPAFGFLQGYHFPPGEYQATLHYTPSFLTRFLK